MPDTNDIKKAAVRTDKFLERNVLYHKRRLMSAIEELERSIINMVAEFKTSNGTLMGPKVNFKLAQKTHAQLSSLFKETYGVESREVVKGFNQSLKYIKKDFKSLDVVMDYTSVDKDMVKTLKTNALNNFAQFGDTARDQVADVMYTSVLGKTSYAVMVGQISGILTGHLDKRGRSMSQYADLYAHDAIMDFHNSVHLKKAEDLGFKYFLYYGNAMINTRDFCRRRIGKVFSKEEIESWDFPWNGKSGPAMTNRGGYNCRHHWRPVRKNWVDEDKLKADLEEEAVKSKKGDVPLMTSADKLTPCVMARG